MTHKTLIPGKDAALEDSIQGMQKKLLALGFRVEEASWLNPVPHCWSVHLRDRDCGLMYTNGKGATRKAALASALGEYFERLNCNYFFADFYLGEAMANGPFVHYPNEKWFAADGKGLHRDVLKDPALRAFYDPQNELNMEDLVETNSGNFERGVCTVPYQRVRDGRYFYFPLNLIGNLYVSNGMSAGNTVTEARTQALSEVFERYVKNKIIREEISLPDVPQAVLKRYPHILEAIGELRRHGFHIYVKDASLGGRFPVMNVTLINPVDGGCFASFGAHPRFEVALERTLTELLQGRNLDQLNVFREPTFDTEDVASDQNIEEHFIDSSGVISWRFFHEKADYEFSPWDFRGTTMQEYARLAAIIHQLGHDIYVSDYYHLGVYGCRIIVPGMSEIYPISDLQWENNNAGLAIREPMLNLSALDKGEIEELYEGIQAYGFVDEHPVSHVIGVAPDPNTVWADLRFADVKLYLAAALGNYEEAENWASWRLSFGSIDDGRARELRCLKALIKSQQQQNYSLRDCGSIAREVYGEKAYQTALGVMEKTNSFPGLPQSDLSLKGFKLHRSFLQGYEKLQRAKQKKLGCFPTPQP